MKNTELFINEIIYLWNEFDNIMQMYFLVEWIFKIRFFFNTKKNESTRKWCGPWKYRAMLITEAN